jgi:hypothetical protein
MAPWFSLALYGMAPHKSSPNQLRLTRLSDMVSTSNDTALLFPEGIERQWDLPDIDVAANYWRPARISTATPYFKGAQ